MVTKSLHYSSGIKRKKILGEVGFDTCQGAGQIGRQAVEVTPTETIPYVTGNSGGAILPRVYQYTRKTRNKIATAGGTSLRLLLPVSTAELPSINFEFSTGNSNNVGEWSATVSPSPITIRRGAGDNGSDRVTLTRHNRAIVGT